MSIERRVLVTGGSGLIGSHVVDALVSEGSTQVVVVDRQPDESALAGALASGRVELAACDLRDETQLSAALEGVDAVIHLAALLTLESSQVPREALEVNIVASHSLLEAAVRLGVSRFVFGSSVGVYGPQPPELVVDEDAPINARTLYGAAKFSMELYCRSFHDMYGLPYFALRFGTIYGPRQHLRGFFPRVLHRVLDDLDAERVPSVEGSPDEVHDFLYVGDAARAVLLALDSQIPEGVANVVSSKPVTLREVVATLLEVYGAAPDVQWVERKDSTLNVRRRFNGARAEQTLGFTSAVSLAEGLGAFIDWRAQSRSS
jgi:UDP-glucose 4-epimerase